MQEIGNPRWKWPMQAWLQPMQARMSSVCPAFASPGISGSQIIALVITQASACPAAMICSASCGWLIRPATRTGTVTAARSFADSGAT